MAKPKESQEEAPASRDAEWEWKTVPRDEHGRFRPGISGNPCGISKEAVQARRIAIHYLPLALARAGEMLNHPDWRAVASAINEVTSRALGRHSTLAELPSDMVLPPASDSSSASLLSRLKGLMERGIAACEQQVAEGLPLSDAQRTALREDAQALAILQKAEADLGKEGPGAALSDEVLLEKVLGSVSPERLQAELSKRGAA